MQIFYYNQEHNFVIYSPCEENPDLERYIKKLYSHLKIYDIENLNVSAYI